MNPKEIVKKGYDAIGGKYTSERNENLREMDFLPEFTKCIPEGGKILDLGCGGGIPFTKYLSKRFEVIGIDISPGQIKLARKNVKDASFICSDVTTFKFPRNFFDGILAYYSIIHIPRNEHFPLFSKMHSILKPKGVVLMSLHSNDDPESIYDDFFGTKMYWSGFGKEENLKLIKNAGFNLIWSKLVQDSLGDSKHLFVLVQKLT